MGGWSVGHTVKVLSWLSYLIVLDVYVYGLILPAIGTLLGSLGAVYLGADPFTEIILVVLAVFALLYGIFYLNLESQYWRLLFSQDASYMWILKFRDLITVKIILNDLLRLYHCFEAMSISPMKTENLGEGLDYVFWNTISSYRAPIPEFIMERYNISKEQEIAGSSSGIFWDFWGIWDAPIGGNQTTTFQIMINSSAFIFCIACLTSAVIKLLYFNTLHTYRRSMDIFITMQDEIDRERAERIQAKSTTSSAVSNYISDFSMVQPEPKKSALVGLKRHQHLQEHQRLHEHEHLHEHDQQHHRVVSDTDTTHHHHHHEAMYS